MVVHGCLEACSHGGRMEESTSKLSVVTLWRDAEHRENVGSYVWARSGMDAAPHRMRWLLKPKPRALPTLSSSETPSSPRDRHDHSIQNGSICTPPAPAPHPHRPHNDIFLPAVMQVYGRGGGGRRCRRLIPERGFGLVAAPPGGRGAAAARREQGAQGGADRPGRQLHAGGAAGRCANLAWQGGGRRG